MQTRMDYQKIWAEYGATIVFFVSLILIVPLILSERGPKAKDSFVNAERFWANAQPMVLYPINQSAKEATDLQNIIGKAQSASESSFVKHIPYINKIPDSIKGKGKEFLEQAEEQTRDMALEQTRQYAFVIYDPFNQNREILVRDSVQERVIKLDREPRRIDIELKGGVRHISVVGRDNNTTFAVVNAENAAILAPKINKGERLTVEVF
ncbi:MAG: hypothetical protein ACOCWW_00530 [Bacteroidota bacterium]